MPSSPMAGRSRFPRGLVALGWVSLATAGPLSLRVLYEQTWLTFQNGVQMLGFSLAHLMPLFLLIGYAGVACAHLFFLILIILAVSRIMPIQAITAPIAVMIVTLGLAIGILYVPYETWILLMVKTSGPGAHGADYLRFAAAGHHPYLLKTLLDSGVRDEAPGTRDDVLNAACVGKDIQSARELIAQGAKLSNAPDCEWFYELTGKRAPPRMPGTSIEVRP